MTEKSHAKSLNLINEVRKSFPPNVRAYVYSMLGGDKEFTEKDLSESYLNTLRKLAANSIDPGVIDYLDYLKETDPTTYERYLKSLDTTMGNKHKYADSFLGNVNIADKNYNLATLLGQAGYTKNKDGDLVITDTFNFNDAGKRAREPDFKEKILQLADYFRNPPSYSGYGVYKNNDPSLTTKLYSTARKAAQMFGPGNKKGMPIKINLGPAEGILNTKSGKKAKEYVALD